MPDGNNSSSIPLWKRFFNIDDRLRKLGPPPPNQEIFKLTVSQLILLKHLYSMSSGGDGVTLKDLAKAHGVTPATASEMVDSLVRKKVIVRTDNPADRRSILLRPSDQWFSYFKNYEKELSRQTDIFFSTLPPDKLQVIMETTAAMEDFLSKKETEAGK